MTVLSAQIDATGISAPDFADILQQLRIIYWSIYGSDANLDDDAQDGQFLSALAQVIDDNNQVAIAVYNSFSPATGQGAALSRNVKLNGLTRDVSSNSTAPVLIVGVVGTEINNGQIGDNLGLGTTWNLPALVTIPGGGDITVTATCTEAGAVTAATATLTNILTPTRGWQTVSNTSDAAVGQPVETDAQLRVRQSNSVSLPALTSLESIFAAVDAVPGVSRLAVYQNDTGVVDANGIAPHSIAVVVQGGDVTAIAQQIADKKSPGTGTVGTTAVLITDQNGVPDLIRFYELANQRMVVDVTIKALTGYVSTTGDTLVQSVVDFENSLAIGEDSYLARLYTPANLGGVGLGATYVVTAITQSIFPAAPGAVDVPILFNQAAQLATADVTLTVT